MTLIKIVDNKVCISTGYELRSLCASIPGAKWNKDQKCWSCAATISSARAVLDAFRGTPCKADQAFRDLVKVAKQQAEVAEQLRAHDATGLPPIPLTRTKPWAHQVRAYHFLYPLQGGMAALDMGEQPLDEPVLTPNGWVEIGKLRVGDSVIGVDGKPTEVVGVYDFESRPLCKVTLADGGFTYCSTTHLWTVRSSNKGWETIPTSEVASTLGLHYNNKKNKLPELGAVRFASKALPVDPYVLGVLLSDGSLTQNKLKFTSNTPAIVAEIVRRGYNVTTEPDGKHHNITGRSPKALLSVLGLNNSCSRSKFVPRDYLLGCPKQRMDLLRGLMDGDGTQCGRSAIYTTISEQLAKDVSFLARSLGGSGSVNLYDRPDKGKVWNVSLGLPMSSESPFLATSKCRGRKRNSPRRIVSIEETGKRVPMRCIKVANNDGLYVTRDFVVTHNTGKSAVTTHLVVNRGHKRTLILAPLSVIQEWPNQFQTHAARRVGVYRPYAKRQPLTWDETSPFEKNLIVCPLDNKAGSVKDKLDGARMAFFESGMNDADTVVVTNYESVWRPPFDDWAMEAGWDLVVCDEVHRIQSASGKASRFMSRLGDRVPYRLGLTGTPFSSGPLSIYGQYRFLDKTIFGTSNKHFKSRYAKMGGFQQHQVVGYQNESELQKKFYSIAFRVESRDVLDLPEETHVRRYFTLPPATMRAYKELETILVTQIKEGEITVSNALVKLLRLQQITSGFARVDPTDSDEGKVVRIDDEKQKLLADVLLDLDKREPIVVFARFTHDLEAVKAVCDAQGRRCAFLDGSRKQTDEWRNGDYDVLAIQIRAGGVGVNLTRSHYCVYYSLGYSLSDYLQSLARTMRPGQNCKVTYVHLLAADSVDLKVYDALDAKKDVVDSILEGYQSEILT